MASAPGKFFDKVGGILDDAETSPVIIEFDVDDNKGARTEHVAFKSSPLGLAFGMEAPFAVTCITENGPGDLACVQRGWTFAKIAGFPVHRLDHKSFVEVLRTQLSSLPRNPDPQYPPSAILIEFIIDPEIGRVRTCGFTKRPIGFTWGKAIPIKVKQVVPDSHAAELGVQKGWEVKSIDGQTVIGRASMEAAFNSAEAQLPQLPAGSMQPTIEGSCN
jgi:hypothetical protein